jgi:hypothetical protein
MDDCKIMEHSLGNTDRGKQEYCGEIFSHCSIFYHKYHMKLHTIELGPTR